MELTSEAIAEYATSLTYDQLPDAAIDATRRLVLDSLGCCLGAYTSPPSKRLRALYGAIEAEGGTAATVFGAGTGTRLEYAGLINATMVRYLDFNDTYISQGRACHPSDHIPAVLSTAEAMGSDGRELIEAIVLAYEVEGLGLDTGVAWQGGYDYVTWGAYSTVAAVGRLMGLSRRQLVDALGIAGASNLTLSVSRRGEVSMWKGIAHPYVSHNAIQACQMARAGVTGPAEVFEGPGGFSGVTAGEPIDVDRLGGQTSDRYRIAEAHIKPYPCGYYMQPMIAGIIDLVREHDLRPDDISQIRVETFREAATILGTPEKWSTELTRESADHSIPYTAAVAILHRDVRPEHYNQQHREDPAVHELMKTVTVEERAALNDHAASNPRATPTVVRLRADDGEYRRRIDHAPGHAENPLPDDALRAKATDLAGALLSDHQVEAMIDRCDELERLPRVDPLIEATVV